jgi:hypothetical protein
MCPRARPELAEGFASVFWALTWASRKRNKNSDSCQGIALAMPPNQIEAPLQGLGNRDACGDRCASKPTADTAAIPAEK